MNKKDETIATVFKKAQIYRTGGFKEAQRLSHNIDDFEDHLYAFLIDINCCFLPVYIWVILFLLILCGLVPPFVFDILFYVIYVILFITCVIGLGIITSKTQGQSIGYYLAGLRLVNLNDKRPASSLHLIMRQMLGFGIPMMVLGFFFRTTGIIAWWAINGICVCVTPHQQTLFDLVFRLTTVKEQEVNVQIVQETEEVVVEQQKPVAPVYKKTDYERSPIDLHLRSNYSSDGCYDVEELFKQAKENNMEVISITDHNCARVNAAALRFSQLYNIQYIPGVEFDCQYRGLHIRVLGYYIDLENKIFDILEQAALKRDKQASIDRVKKFEEFTKIAIDIDSFISKSRFQIITAKEITGMVFKNPQTRQMRLMQHYLKNTGSEQEALMRFERDVFGPTGPCYVESEYPALDQIIKAIHQANGIAILSSWKLDEIDDERIEQIIEVGLDGIECFSPEIHTETMTAVLKIAHQYKLFVSCGSDYHGPTKPERRMGQTNCPEKGLPLVRIFTRLAE